MVAVISYPEGPNGEIAQCRTAKNCVSARVSSPTHRLSGWPNLPPEIVLGDVAAIAVDRRDQGLSVQSWRKHPMVVVRPDGSFREILGRGASSSNPHGVHIGPDDTVFCTDDGDHSVRKCTLDGQVLLTLGTPGRPAPRMDGQPFCRCCHTALAANGDIYVADGYGNARIHKFAPDGKLLFSWGEPGTEPGNFNLPHNICVDADGWVYVADRENHRIQVFDGNGRYETQINNLHRPSALMLLGGTCP